jgi:Mg-chelatase subunit ChlD
VLGLVARIQPEQGTPLARGLERAGNMLDGVGVPGVIVVVTDGEDSCGGDPCAVAKALKRKKPNLKINVIGVGGSGKGRCMAEATGGRFVTPRPGQSWKDVFMQATEQKPLPPGCE